MSYEGVKYIPFVICKEILNFAPLLFHYIDNEIRETKHMTVYERFKGTQGKRAIIFPSMINVNHQLEANSKLACIYGGGAVIVVVVIGYI